jgi:hypothetical protein
MTNQSNARDEDAGKGAVEQDRPGQTTNTSLAGQIGHRDQDPLVKSSDSDFPEPGNNEEHSGEPHAENQLNHDTNLECKEPAQEQDGPASRQKGKSKQK